MSQHSENTPRRRRPSSSSESLIENGVMENGGREEGDRSDLRGDKWNIAILFFLYVLQGIPLGLSAAIPMYLQNRGVSYRQQAEFSLVQWPFSLKLLWAPIVDSVYSSWFGRRKSWMVPSQYLIGLFMLFLSANVESWLEVPNIMLLTFCFFVLNFLAATQDIAVDGWALTMLKRRNVGHASTCNSVGQTAGYFLGYVVFMGLESAPFCNAYLRSEPSDVGMVSLPGYLYFWAVVFIVTTTLVAVLKSELPPRHSYPEAGLENLTIAQSYKLLYDITQLPVIRKTALILLTAKIGFCACDSVTSLKLIDAGVPKEKLAMLAVPLVPLQIVLPLIISKYTVGTRPMDVFTKAFPYRLAFGLVAAFLVYITPFMVEDGQVPMKYYAILLGSYGLHQISLYGMYVAVMAFFARVSDPAVGGTYMTLLNTLSNLGGNWPATLALWLVDSLTVASCSDGSSCVGQADAKICKENGGECETSVDGYYVEIVVCFVIGLLWLGWGRRKINELQAMDDSAWHVVRRRDGR